MNTQNMKKQLPMIAIGLITLVILIGGGAFLYVKLLKKPAPVKTAQQTQKKRITDPANVIAQSDRPYVEIIPTDIHNIEIAVDQLKKPATSMDFEIEYQTDSSLEGFNGSLDLTTVPAKTKPLLLGSCSAGGACRYHTNVQGGDMTLKFSGAENYVLKQTWHYITNSTRGTQFASQDGYFQIDSKDLAPQKLFIIYNTPGYPGNPGNVVSEAYALSAPAPMTGKGSLTMRAKEDLTSASIMGYDGQNWKDFGGKVDGKSITAQVDLLPAYVVVKK